MKKLFAPLTALLIALCLVLPGRTARALPLEGLLAWPNDNPKLSGCFVDDMRGYDHYAVDIAGGKQIYACEKGTVIASVEDPFWGNTILIRHDDLRVDGSYLFTEYAHLSKRLVEKGDTVTLGQQIGVMGKTGRDIDFVHLHLMVKVSDRYEYDSIQKDGCVDPALYLNVPENLGVGFSRYSTCCDDYYAGLTAARERHGMLRLGENETFTTFTTYTQGERLKKELSGRITTDASVAVQKKTRARWITYVRVRLTDESGADVYAHTAYPNKSFFELSTLKLGKEVRALAPGAYRLTILARDEAGYQDTLIDQGLTVYAAEAEEKNRESEATPLTDAEKTRLLKVASMGAVLPEFSSSVTLTKAQMLAALSVNYWEEGLSAAGVLSGGGTGEISAISAGAFLKSVLGVALPDPGAAYSDPATGIVCKDGMYTVPKKAYAVYPYLIGTETIRGGAVRASFLLLSEDERSAGPSEKRLQTPDLVMICSRGGAYFGFTILSIETNTHTPS